MSAAAKQLSTATIPADAPQVSIVVPVYNEASRLPLSMEKMAEYFGKVPFTHEVLMVVEKSADGTLELARRLAKEQVNFHVIDNAVHRGKGYAVRSGMRRATGRHVFYMDVDLSVPLDEIERFLEHFEKHPQDDVLIGNRQHPQSRIELSQGWMRRAMGQLFNHALRALALADRRDTQCGFKAFRQSAAREIFARQTIDGFAFDVEVLLLAEALGFSVCDLPVRWVNSSESKVHIVRDSLRMLLDVATIRRQVEKRLSKERGEREKRARD